MPLLESLKEVKALARAAAELVRGVVLKFGHLVDKLEFTTKGGRPAIIRVEGSPSSPTVVVEIDVAESYMRPRYRRVVVHEDNLEFLELFVENAEAMLSVIARVITVARETLDGLEDLMKSVSKKLAPLMVERALSG